jgi:tetratricopeptide (TPR) repeat protein
LGLALLAASWVGYGPLVKWWKTRQAVSIFQEALQAARSIESEVSRSEALGKVAEAMARAGREQEAADVFQEALQIAQGIESKVSRSEALGKVAEAMARAGRFHDSLQIARGIEDAGVRARVLAKLAEVVLGMHEEEKKP